MSHPGKQQTPVIQVQTTAVPPNWALWQRKLFDAMNEAAREFVQTFTRPDGTIVWRDEWPGMDGSDDSYEGFMHLPLLYLLGGSDEFNGLSRKLWDAFTWQWTEYGQIYREFDAYYDWMHHGESSLFLYFLALADPTVLKDRQRAVKFANLYMGDDPEAQNYDKERKLIRSPINGSRGPRFTQTEEDWCTHREVLDDYPPPFEDIPGVPGPLCQWTDDAIYAAVLERINARMSKGDVPLNLTSTSLVAHAYLYGAGEKYRNWVLEYFQAWKERTDRNGGITPDNVGLSGEIGEYMDGKWWGGYYGWRWPHGSFTIIESLVIAGSNARLLGGGSDSLDLARSQIDALWVMRQEENGRWVVPNKHLDEGWTDYRPPNALYPIYLWTISFDEADLKRVRRVQPNGLKRQVVKASSDEHKGLYGNHEQWFEFIQGNNPSFPEDILRVTYELMLDQLKTFRTDDSDPASWDIHYWQMRTPVILEGLTQTTLGTPMHIYHGGLLHASVRYFDGLAGRAGLPDGVAALVQKLAADNVTLALINLDPFHDKEVIIQAGTFGEHRFDEVTPLDIDSGHAFESKPVGSKWLTVKLGPGAGSVLELKISRYVNTPSYVTPFASPLDLVYLQGRSI